MKWYECGLFFMTWGLWFLSLWKCIVTIHNQFSLQVTPYFVDTNQGGLSFYWWFAGEEIDFHSICSARRPRISWVISSPNHFASSPFSYFCSKVGVLDLYAAAWGKCYVRAIKFALFDVRVISRSYYLVWIHSSSCECIYQSYVYVNNTRCMILCACTLFSSLIFPFFLLSPLNFTIRNNEPLTFVPTQL